MILKSFEILDNTLIDDSINKLFEVDNEWYKSNTVENFIREIRGEDE